MQQLLFVLGETADKLRASITKQAAPELLQNTQVVPEEQDIASMGEATPVEGEGKPRRNSGHHTVCREAKVPRLQQQHQKQQQVQPASSQRESSLPSPGALRANLKPGHCKCDQF